MKRLAQALLDWLKKNSQKCNWNKNLEVSYEGKSISNSNVADLFHIFSVNKKGSIKAQKEPLQASQDMHIPESFIKNRYLLSHTHVNEKRKSDAIIPDIPVTQKKRKLNALKREDY